VAAPANQALHAHLVRAQFGMAPEARQLRRTVVAGLLAGGEERQRHHERRACRRDRATVRRRGAGGQFRFGTSRQVTRPGIESSTTMVCACPSAIAMEPVASSVSLVPAWEITTLQAPAAPSK